MSSNLSFNRYIAAILDRLDWRHFGVGALQAYLCEGSLIEQRVHIWHRSLVAPGIRGFGDMHDHRFDFLSRVLCGELTNCVYQQSVNDSGGYDVYSVVNAREQKEKTGSYDGNVQLVGRCDAELDYADQQAAGSEYFFPARWFHVTSFAETTVTLVTKCAAIPDYRARILVPHGAKLVHAFDESRMVDKQRVLNDAKEALRNG